MALAAADSGDPAARRLTLGGRVQGLGVRPTVARLARRLGLSGFVANSVSGVEIHVEGPPDRVAEFVRVVAAEMPRDVSIDRQTERIGRPMGLDGFSIRPSRGEGLRGVTVPADLAVCRNCLAESRGAGDRRFGYPFTTCTECGPRYSVIEALPYDRRRTSMLDFAMCDACAAEYADAEDRRFHSQTNSCGDCGPRLRFVSRSGQMVSDVREALAAAAGVIRRGEILVVKGVGGYQWLADATRDEPVASLRRMKGGREKPLAVIVRDLSAAGEIADVGEPAGAILASPANPIVVLNRHGSSVFALSGRQVSGKKASAPFWREPALRVLRTKGGRHFLPPRSLSADVAAGLDTVGVMLPPTPLHEALACAADRPLVVTSGNLEGEPIPYRDWPAGDAYRDWPAGDDGAGRAKPASMEGLAEPGGDRLGGWLDHDRRIVRPIDDSVVRLIAGHRVTLRLGRGLAPLALPFPESMLDRCGSSGGILAVGGHQKSAVALFNGSQAMLGPHLGDLDGWRSRERFVEQVEALLGLCDVRPSLIVHDRHPDYFTTRWAGEQVWSGEQVWPWGPGWPGGEGVATMAVQHHHAHIAAAMLERGWLDRVVLGVAWDGSGYGDGAGAVPSVWGGEFLVASAVAFRRVGHLSPFRLVGGEAAIRQPWRVAVALVYEALGGEAAGGLCFDGVAAGRISSLVSLLDRAGSRPADGPGIVRTTSAGRLCDGVAALVLGLSRSGYEGQPAMLWESVGSSTAAATSDPGYEIRLGRSASGRSDSGPGDGGDAAIGANGGDGEAGVWELDWRPMIRSVVADRAAGVPEAVISMRFHAGLAAGIARLSERFPDLPVVLGGGCFQNRLLVERLSAAMESGRRPLAVPGTIPPGDGGLAAGQLAVAMARRDAGDAGPRSDT